MKKRKLLSIILCLTLIVSTTSCRIEKEQSEEYPEFLTEREWEYNTLSCSEMLRFHKNGTFSYYEACGNPVGNSDCYERYSYNGETGIVTVYGYDDSVEPFEIAILRHTEDSLLVCIEGKIKEFCVDNCAPGLMGDMYENVEGYSAYMSIGDIHGDMIETAPSDFDVDAGGLELVREEKLSKEAVFYRMYEECVHSAGEEADQIKTEFTEVNREDIACSEDNSFSSGYVWYNENLEITKIVYYGSMEIWE